ncbi:MAG: RluA family pseudouridine synthase [Deltaproteobacteria bacterium]|nr:RluA family pseudouridine synthase [Deltaproteobacteria bacterium]
MRDPRDARGPHPLAREAAEAWMASLRAEPPGWAAGLEAPGGGKMLGVLVVQGPDGAPGVLRAFSGMLEGAFVLPGFVPPLFDVDARAAVEVPGEAEVKALTRRVEEARSAPGLAAARLALEEARQRRANRLAGLKALHAERRDARHARRQAGGLDAGQLHALEQESRGDKAERRRVEAALDAAVASAAVAVKRGERRVAALERLRGWCCRRLMQALHDTYRVPDARGEAVLLRSLFPGGEPPSGAGDCAAPRLLAHAHRAGLRPVALAEFWWGAPPQGGGRREGEFYAPCKDKCGPLLPRLLAGLDVEVPLSFRPAPMPVDALRVVHEDRWLVVVEKPAGLLSVPGREEGVGDSVLARLGGACLAHRLDLDTSGLLVAARTREVHAALQRQFAARTVEKRYVAWVEGTVRGESGRIELPLRVDPGDRPRQVVDALYGLAAVTEWKVVERCAGRTRVHFHPLTGRTHQLRVHAAHPEGLGCAILGDRLYGPPGERLMLHAERLAFMHPGTGERVAFEASAPF